VGDVSGIVGLLVAREVVVHILGLTETDTIEPAMTIRDDSRLPPFAVFTRRLFYGDVGGVVGIEVFPGFESH
jgi:predicted PurR-regulated permease PerM